MSEKERDTFGHLIEVALTEEEEKTQLNRNADIDRKMLLIKAEKAAANSGFNEDLKTLRKEQVTLLESVSSGKAKIEIQCYLERDERLGVMRTLRADNGTQVDERALTADELNEDRRGTLFEGDRVAAPPAEGSDDEPGETADADTEASLEEYAKRQAASAGANDAGGEDEDDDLDHGDSDDAPAVVN